MKAYRFIALILLVVIAITACGSQTASGSQRPLKIAWLVFSGYGPYFIAQEQGLFEKNNVTVQDVPASTTSEQIIDLTSNTADCALVVFSDAVPVAKNTGLKTVMIIDSTNGADQLIASADVTSVADLKGKRIGAAFNSYSEMFVRQLLAKNGLQPGDVELVNVAPEDLVNALGKTVDAGHTYDPFSSQARAAGYHVIASTADVPNLIFDTVICNPSVLNERSQEVRSFVKAWFEAVDWWTANQTDGNAIVASATGLSPQDVSLEGIKLFTLSDNQNAFDVNNPSSFYVTAQQTIDYYASLGALVYAPDLNSLVDSSFLK